MAVVALDTVVGRRESIQPHQRNSLLREKGLFEFLINGRSIAVKPVIQELSQQEVKKCLLKGAPSRELETQLIVDLRIKRARPKCFPKDKVIKNAYH